MADLRGCHDPFYPIAAKADSRSATKSILSSKPTDSLICDCVTFRLALSASVRLACVVVKGWQASDFESPRLFEISISASAFKKRKAAA